MKSNDILKNSAKIVHSKYLPPPRFGHTVNEISEATFVIFGGVIYTPNKKDSYRMTSDLYLYKVNDNIWTKLEPSKSYTYSQLPEPRGAHASATIKKNTVFFYGGSAGKGEFTNDKLWQLEIKSTKEAIWKQVSIEGQTPGQRYGHYMTYIEPNVFLIGGSSNFGQNNKNCALNDVWIIPTNKTPFNWIKLDIKHNSILTPRSYHTVCIYNKMNGSSSIVLFGGRNLDNVPLNDLYVLKKRNNNKYKWKFLVQKNNEPSPISRYQHSSAMFGPFLFVVGGISTHSNFGNFDVFSFISKSWYNFGSICLFRHTIWIYYNVSEEEEIKLSLYIYGGFNPKQKNVINDKIYKIDILKIFSEKEELKKELNEYLILVKKKATNNLNINNNNISNNSNNEINNTINYNSNNNSNRINNHNEINNTINNSFNNDNNLSNNSNGFINNNEINSIINHNSNNNDNNFSNNNNEINNSILSNNFDYNNNENNNNFNYDDIFDFSSDDSCDNEKCDKIIKNLNEENVTKDMIKKGEFKKCLICLENYSVGTKISYLPCCHYFHSVCIKQWLKKSKNCPFCKFHIIKKNRANKE